MDTIDLTPSPLEATRAIRGVLQGAYGLQDLQYRATDRQILKAWHRYEETTKVLGIEHDRGTVSTKALHRELLRSCLTVELRTKDLEPGLTGVTTWEQLNS